MTQINSPRIFMGDNGQSGVYIMGKTTKVKTGRGFK